MTRPVLVSMLALTSFAASAWGQGTTIGTLSVVRQVEVTRTRATPELRDRVEREVATQGESVFDEQLIHTLKRSGAEVAFTNGNTLRLNDRTEAIVRTASLYLQSGKAWMQTGKSSLTVTTPTCSVAANDATFEVIVGADNTRVYCYRGSVTLRRDSRSLVVKTGEYSGVTSSGTQITLDAATDIPGDQRPSDQGGSRNAWWADVARERGLLTLPGSSAGLAIRSSALTESLQAALNMPPPPEDLVKNPADKARLLALSQTSVVPAIERTLATDPALTLSGYRQTFGGDDLSERFTLPSADLSFLRSHGIGNVGELFDALNAAGATFGVDLRSRRTAEATRSVYRPSAWQGPSNVRKPLFDGAVRSNSLLLLGAAAAVALEGKVRTSDIAADAEAFGFTADPQGFGGRLRLYGSLGKTHYQFEGNALRILSGANTQGYDALSVASMEREMSKDLTVFAGRRRFYSGPALLALNRSQLVGERYSAVGASVNRSGMRTEAAWLYDSNPDVRGAQSGFVASSTRQMGGGTIGAQLLQVGSLNNGTGYTISGSMALSPGANQMDAYGEIGVAPDKAGIVTLGLYFPWIYQASDLDVYLEHSSHEGIGSSTTLTANRELTGGASLRAFVGNGQRTFVKSSGFFGGVGLSYPLGRR
nr:FecR family protein [Armatimonas sp.]